MEYLFNNQQSEEKAFLGKGWSFPPAFNREMGRANMVQYEEDIWQSLQILFSTSIRERVVQPSYGCNPEDYVFTQMNTSFLTHLEDLIRKNIARNEPRIKLVQLAVVPAILEGRFEIRLEYIVRSTNSRFNKVFPFYKQEGTNVEI